ncbi:MAG: EF-hand domain-containing protein [Sphingomonas sp.]
MKTLILATALAGTMLGGAAYAAQDQATPAPAAGMHRHHRHHGDMLAKLDTNHDGVITRAEAQAAADARFAKMDTNGDGQIAKDEVQARRDAMRAKWQQRRAARGDQTAPTGQAKGPGAHHGHRHHRDMFAKVDSNNDGVITKAEAEAAAMQRFDKADTNHDGRIDQTEIAAVKAKMQARMQEMRANWQARRAGQSQPMQPADQ